VIIWRRKKEVDVKYIGVIHREFMRIAASWDELGYKWQVEYLKKHPGSDKRITAVPPSKQEREVDRGVSYANVLIQNGKEPQVLNFYKRLVENKPVSEFDPIVSWPENVRTGFKDRVREWAKIHNRQLD
jgi:hypothetical protein